MLGRPRPSLLINLREEEEEEKEKEKEEEEKSLTISTTKKPLDVLLRWVRSPKANRRTDIVPRRAASFAGCWLLAAVSSQWFFFSFFFFSQFVFLLSQKA